MRGSPWPVIVSTTYDLGTTLHRLLAIIPWLNLAYALALYAAGSLSRDLRMIRVQINYDAEGHGDGALTKTQETTYLILGKRQVIIVLQLLVGSIVTFGGTAFTLLAVNSFGTVLGSGHLSIGIIGLYAGILVVRRKVLPSRILLAVNGVTIAYSLLSVSIAAFQSLLPSPALHDSFIGTFAAVVMSGIVIYLARR